MIWILFLIGLVVVGTFMSDQTTLALLGLIVVVASGALLVKMWVSP